MSTIYQKLINIQNDLKAPKSQRNNFGNYNYRSCEDILEALKPILKAYNCAILISDEVLSVENRFYVKATVTLIDADNSEQVHSTALAREPENKKGADESQITGASSSYARKYALNGMFAIDDTKDSDATNKHGKDEESYPSASSGEPKIIGESDLISDKQSKLLFAKSKGYETQAKEILAKHGFTSSKQITKDKFNDILADLQKVINDGI